MNHHGLTMFSLEISQDAVYLSRIDSIMDMRPYRKEFHATIPHQEPFIRNRDKFKQVSSVVLIFEEVSTH